MVEEEHYNTATSGGGGWTAYSLCHHTITTALSFHHHAIFRSDDGDGDGQDSPSNSSNSDIHTVTSANRSNSSNYYYSKMVTLLDLLWNLAFVLVALIVLYFSLHETPSTPLRLWLSAYALHCIFHVAILYHHHHQHDLSSFQTSIMKRLESINIMISSIWWVLGFYWIVIGGQALLQDSPYLYWSTVVFLAFDVFYMIICVGIAFVIFIAIFCCLPILAIAYAISIRKGASEDDIKSLPKYRYCRDSPLKKLDNEKQEASGARVGSSNNDELALLPEDSECCICLSRYLDGEELYTLPCNHHFHCRCISKWLRINATCPLCKFNIRRGDTLV